MESKGGEAMLEGTLRHRYIPGRYFTEQTGEKVYM
jgi:hypothetical protein